MNSYLPLISLLFLTTAACPSGAVDADSCSQVQVGDGRQQVNSILGPVGGGGGGEDWCHVWWGEYVSGPCCAVQLTTCDSSGTVTAVAFDAGGCASPSGGSSSGGSSGGSSSGGSTGSTPTGGGGIANLSLTSDTTYDLPDTTFTHVNCDSEDDGGMSFQYPDWGGTTFIVHGTGFPSRNPHQQCHRLVRHGERRANWRRDHLRHAQRRVVSRYD